MNTDWRSSADEILLNARRARYLDLAILWEPVLPMCREVVGTYKTLSIRIADGELNDFVDASIWATIRVAIDGISRIRRMVALVGIDDFLGTYGKEVIASFEESLPDEDIRLLHTIGLDDDEIKRLALRDAGKSLDQRGDRTVSEFLGDRQKDVVIVAATIAGEEATTKKNKWWSICWGGVKIAAGLALVGGDIALHAVAAPEIVLGSAAGGAGLIASGAQDVKPL